MLSTLKCEVTTETTAVLGSSHVCLIEARKPHALTMQKGRKSVFWDATPYNGVDMHPRFRINCYLYEQRQI